MADRARKDKAGVPRIGVETDRVKDLPKSAPTVADRRQGRTAGGQFAPGNTAAKGRGWRGLIRDSLGPATDETTVVRLADMMLKTYRADVAALPAQTPSILADVAAGARHGAIATFYASEAAKTGLTSPLGLKLAEASARHDLAAGRHRTAAFTRAARVAESEAQRERERQPTRIEEARQAAALRLASSGGSAK